MRRFLSPSTLDTGSVHDLSPSAQGELGMGPRNNSNEKKNPVISSINAAGHMYIHPTHMHKNEVLHPRSHRKKEERN